jgi:hypothetical protein
MMNGLTVKLGVGCRWVRPESSWNWNWGGEFGRKKVRLGLMGNSRFFHAGPFFQKSPAFKLPNYQLFTYLCSRN